MDDYEFNLIDLNKVGYTKEEFILAHQGR